MAAAAAFRLLRLGQRRRLVDPPHRPGRLPGHARLRATQTLASGDQLAIRIVGSVVIALHYTSTTGWQQVLTYNTSTDSTRYTAAGNLALEFRSSTVDNFGGGTIP